MKKQIFLMLCVCFFILSIAGVSAGENGTLDNSLQIPDMAQSDDGAELLSVNQWFVNGSKSEDGNGSVDAPFNNLKSSLDASNDGDVIYIAEGTYDGSGLNVNLTIDKSLTLIGEGNVILHGNDTRIFTISANSFNIEGLTFMGGNSSSSNGGAIYFANGLTESVINATFINNHAFEGGAVFFNNAVTDNAFACSFIGNDALAYGGAIYIGGESKNNRWKILCDNNTAILNGGAVFLNATSTNNTFEGDFTRNLAKGTDGGALFFNGESNYDAFTGNYYNNTAIYYGGAIKFASHVDHDIFSGNFKNQMVTAGSAATMRFDWGASNCVFSGNFIDNHLVGFNTAGISMGGIAYNNTFSGTFINNTEGALFFGGRSINNVFNGAFINHTAKYIGAVSFDDDSINDTFSGTFINNYASVKHGGAITFNLGAVNATFDGIFINNRAYFNGGAIAIFQAFNFIYPANNLKISARFINNTAGRYGGSIYIEYADNVSIVNSDFESNNALNGGGIYVGKNVTSLHVENCNFTDNSANNGGAVYFNDEIINATISGYFKGNTAENAGGAIYFAGLGEIINCNFINNNATVEGGALWSSSCKVENSKFNNNKVSEGDGGAIYISGNTTVINSNFTGNEADRGSAIYLWYEKGLKYIRNISHSIFLNNKASMDHKTPFNVSMDGNNMVIKFMGNDNLLNAIYSRGEAEVNITNVTYWGANGIENTGVSTIVPAMSDEQAGQNITVAGVINGNSIKTTKVTDADGKIVLENVSGDYWICVSHEDDSYYTSAKNVLTNMQISAVGGKVTVAVPSDVTGKVSIIINNVTYPVTIVKGIGTVYASSMPSGVVTVVISNDSKYGNVSYEVNLTALAISLDSNRNVNVFYLETSSYSVRVIDANKHPVSGVKVKFTVAGKTKYASTNNKGIATIKLSLAPGKYTITANYLDKTVKNSFVVKQIISAKKTSNVKKSKKTTLITIAVKGHKVKQAAKVKFTYKGKNNVKVSFGKDMKKQTVTVKFKGKNYKVKVNAKGKGTLKLTKKLAKKLIKGKKYTTKVTYKGPKLYKKVKLTVKFNGKKYKVKTNAKGVAKFKVTKNMVKKLKKGKKLAYTITYKQASLTRYVKIK